MYAVHLTVFNGPYASPSPNIQDSVGSIDFWAKAKFPLVGQYHEVVLEILPRKLASVGSTVGDTCTNQVCHSLATV